MKKQVSNKIICAVSGGADSLCMLHKFRNKDVICAHFDHQIRDNSINDAKYVEQICNEWNIPFILGSFNIKKHAAENKLSLEFAARIKRYEFLIDLAKRKNAIIATAHNANDSAESVLMHLFRGCGSNGLSGISEKIIMDGIEIVRPIINLSRAEVEDYCEQNDIKYLTDETNFDTDFFRNKIRHNIMPHIENITPILRSAKIISDESDFLDKIAKNWIHEHFIDSSFNAKKFLIFDLAIKRRILFNILSSLTEATISFERIESLIEVIEKNVGNKTIQFPDGIEAYLTKNILTIKKVRI